MTEKTKTLLALGPFALRPFERLDAGRRATVSGEALIARGAGNITIAEFEDVEYAEAVLELLNARAAEDWTVSTDGPDAGRCNTSPEFVRLSARVAEIIRGSASALLLGQTEGVGTFIMAQLAHRENVGPR